MIPDGWTSLSFGEFTTLQRGHDLPDRERRQGSVPIIGSFGITGWHDQARAPGPGVTVGRSGGSFGVVSYSPSDYWPLNTALYVTDFHGNDEQFAYYFLKQFDFKRYNSGSAQPSLNRNFIHPAIIAIPPLVEQRAIANILRMLDDKIDLNRRMNETLEALITANYHQFTKDAKNWDAKPIGDSVTVRGGSTPSTSEPSYWTGGSHAWATPKDLSRLQSPVLLATNRRITDEGLARISSGLMPAGTVLLSSRAPIGYLVIAEVPVAVNQGFIAMICDGPISNYYVWQWTVDNMETIKARANGSTFQEISKANFRPIPIAIPPVDKLASFTATVEPLYKLIVANVKESKTLVKLRDTLLPELISGRMRLKDAQVAVGAAV
jgi:type I restriction enzyme, S subunit